MGSLVFSVTPSLSEQLKRRTNKLRSSIIKANYYTQFAQTASELAEFRDANPVGGMDYDILSDSFRKTVQFTTYESYAPLIARFFEKPCSKASAVANLLAPGLPDYLAKSSSTSGGFPKVFPKYDCLSQTTSSGASPRTIADSLRTRSRAYLSQFQYSPIRVEDENNQPIKTIYLTGVSVVNRRKVLDLHPEDDRERMATCILDHVAPFAAGFVNKWRPYLLVHAIFAIGSRSLETMTISYTSTFVDMMRYVDTEFDMILNCIASGTIPELDGMVDVRHYLQANMFPDRERAAELRSLGRPSSQSGWCRLAWPNLRSITTTASGSFATYLPLARWFLGPSVDIHSRGYRSTEGVIALPYNPLELNQYKLDEESVIEFLDISKVDSISSLAQVWEIEVGKRYEVILTTRDGLWRYRLGDVVEVAGFDPMDGVPIIEFVERRNVAIRFTLFMVTEEELSAAISSMMLNSMVHIVGWTATIDDRSIPATIGFFVELADQQDTNLALATQHVLDTLSRSNERLAGAVEFESFRTPTIRLVQSGTFSDFLQLKLDEGAGNNLTQAKVPAVLHKAEYVAWFSNRVVQEL